MSRMTPAEFEDLRRRKPHLFPQEQPKITDSLVAYGMPGEPNQLAPKKRLRQSSKPLLNKLETACLAHLKLWHPECTFHSQAVKFKLGNGVTLQPDFVCFDYPALSAKNETGVACFECKGPHAWEDSMVKLKVAAGLYPQIRWTLIWKENGQWLTQAVLS